MNNELMNVNGNENMENTSVGLFDDSLGNMIANLGTAKQSFSSFTANTQEEKIQFYNMVNNPTAKLKDNINIPFNLKDVYIETVQCEQIDANGNQTGVFQNCPRIVLATDEGTCYQCVSLGVLSSLDSLFRIFGLPQTWKTPIKVQAQLVSTKNGRSTMVLKAVEVKAK